MFALGIISTSGSQYFYIQGNLFPVLDMKFNGTNGSTTFTDDTSRHTTSFSGNVALSTAQSVSAPSSLFLNGTAGFIRADNIGYNTDFVFYGDFIISFDLRVVNTNFMLPFILSNTDSDAGSANGSLFFTTSGGNAALSFAGVNLASTTITSNTWTNFKIARTGNTITYYKNNLVIKGLIQPQILGYGNIYLMGNTLYAPSTNLMNGYIDNFRVTNNGANLANTTTDLVQRLQFNGANGGTVFTDTTSRHTLVILSGSPTTVTSLFYEGTASLSLPSGNNAISSGASSTDFIFGSDFNISLYFYSTSVSASSTMVYFDSLTLQLSNNKVLFAVRGIHGNDNISPVNSFSINTWTKVELKRVGVVVTVTLDNDIANSASIVLPETLGDGVIIYGTNNGNPNALIYLDDIIVYKTSQVPSNTTIVQNLRFNGANATSIFTDSTARHPVGNAATASVVTHSTATFIEGTAGASIPTISTGNGSYLMGDATGIHNDFIFTGNFTIAMYFRTTTTATASALVFFGVYQVLINNSGAGVLSVTNGTTTISATNTFTINTWNKATLTRTGNVTKIILNDDYINLGTTTLYTGTLGDGNINYGNRLYYVSSLNALFIDDIIVINNDASVTLDNTLVLQLQFNGTNGGTTFTDTLARHTMTRTGTGTTSTAQFTEGSASYLSPVGNNYLSTDASNDFIWASDFNITFWFRPTSTTVSSVLFSFTDFALKTTTSGSNISLAISGTHGSTTLVPTNTFTNTTWNKVVFKRVGSTTYLILNDDTANQATTTATQMTSSIGDSILKFGNQTAIVASTAAVNIDNIVVSKKIITQNTNTVLLMSFNGINNEAVFIDYSLSIKQFSATGGAVLSTSNKKFGVSSLAVSSGSYISATADYVNLDTGSSDFTIECWCYMTNKSSTPYIMTLRDGATHSWVLWASGDGLFEVRVGGVNYQASAPSSNPMIDNTWQHIAAVRSGTTLTLYVDGIAGTAVTGVSGALDHASGGVLRIGGFTNSLNGNIDDVRITTTARYTANFTPPTSENDITS